MIGYWLTILNTAGLIIVGIMGYLGYNSIHILINSRMSEMLELAKKAGMLDEKRDAADTLRLSKNKE